MIEFLLWFAETTLAISALIIVVLIIRGPFSKIFGARFTYILWLAPLIRFFLPELNILPAPNSIAIAADTIIMLPAAGFEVSSSGIDAGAILAAGAVFLWAAVAIAWIGFALEKQSRYVRAMMATSVPAAPRIMERAQSVSKTVGLAKAPRIRISNTPTGPVVIGLFRPMLVLPQGFETSYSANEQRLALAHELSHIARGDLFVALGVLVFQALQWPNPLVHMAKSAFRTDQEAACDAYVIALCADASSAPGEYASAIIKSARGAFLPATGLYMGHPVKERLMLLNKTKTPLRTAAGGVSAAALLAIGLAATASYGYAADKDTKTKAESGETKTVVKKTSHMIIQKMDKDGKVVIKKLDGHGMDDFDIDMDRDVHFDGENVFVMKTGHGEDFDFMFTDGGMPFGVASGYCTSEDGEAVKLEWKDEEGDDNNKHVTHTVICLSGDETADPAKRKEALRDAIDRMEDGAKKDAERRKKMIAALRKQLKKMD